MKFWPWTDCVLSCAAVWLISGGGLSGFTQSGTQFYTNGSVADVAAAVAAAQEGNTVNLPPGNFTWNSSLNLNKPISLRGAGKGQTIITDNAPGGGILLLRGTVPGKRYEVSGFTMRDGAASASSHAIQVSGMGDQIVFHDIKLDDLDARYIAQFLWTGSTTGVVYNCDFVSNDYIFMIENGSNWKGVGTHGANSWATPTNFGSSEFVFIENCTFSTSGANQILRVTDGSRGGRFVMRHCNLTDCTIAWHGTDSSGFQRGFRCAEIYNNTFSDTSASVSKILQARSGSCLFHNNTILSGYPQLATLNVYRATSKESGKYGGANGLGDSPDGNQYDDVDLTDGAETPGGAGDGVFEAGIATNTQNFGVTDGSKSWAANQWVGYTLINKRTRTFGSIRSNTADSITTDNLVNLGPGLSFAAGDGYEVRRVAHILDQPGMGMADLIQVQAGPPYDALPAGWSNQALEPCYEWNNSWPTGDVDWSTAYVHVRENVHFYNDTPKPGYTTYTYPHPLRAGMAPGVDRPPSMLSQPQSLNLTEGDEASFVVVAGGTAPLAYQWQKDEVDIVGATSPNLVISNVTPADAGSYRCEINNSFGAVVSEDALLSVTPPSPPEIVDSPQAYTRTIGQSVSLSVTANGSSPLAYQWQREVVLDNSEQTTSIYWLDISGATSSVFTLQSVTLADEGNYRCVVSNGLGSAFTAAAFLKIKFAEALALTSGLLAYLPFDEESGTTVLDATGNGLDGNLQGASRTSLGIRVNGLDFDGLDDFVTLPSFDIFGDGVSFSLWFKADDLFSRPYRDGRLLSKADGREGENHYWMISTNAVGSETRLRFRLKAGGTTSALIASSGNIQDGEWIHVVAVYDGARMLLYQNQQLVGSMSKTGMIDFQGSMPVNIGRNPDGYGEWDGLIDEVAIYNRALNPSEVQALYQRPSLTDRPSAPTGFAQR